MIKYIEIGSVKELVIPEIAILPGQTEKSVAEMELLLMERRDGIKRELYVEPPKTLREILSDEITAGTKTTEQANSILRENFEAEIKANYAQKSDPLFFEYQAGDLSKKEWEAARQAVKDNIKEPEYFAVPKTAKVGK